jgi:uncharacterized lipoprotein YajG
VKCNFHHFNEEIEMIVQEVIQEVVQEVVQEVISKSCTV